MKSPFSELRDLILAFWYDPVFIWLVLAVFASGVWFWLFAGVSWEVACSLVALGCFGDECALTQKQQDLRGCSEVLCRRIDNDTHAGRKSMHSLGEGNL